MNWLFTVVRWIRETFVAKAELFEMHWRHFHRGEGYADVSHDIAMRCIRKRYGNL